MKCLFPCLTCLVLFWLVIQSAAAAEAPTSLQASVLTDANAQPFYFTIPAPRGQILDQEGRPLATTKVMQRLTLRIPPLEEETPEAYVAWVADYWPKVAEAVPGASRPDVELLKQQFEHRRKIPLIISDLLSLETVEAIVQRPEFVDVQMEYARDYPEGTLAAHVLGYVTANGAPLRGPLQYGEPLWRKVAGREGLEASMNDALAGQDGLLVVSYDKEGQAVQRHVLVQPVAGEDVVTTLQLQMQMSVEKALKAAKRPGAMVVVDVSTGSILAIASAPTFDPGLFAKGLDSGTFNKMTKDEDQPLFHRAIGALYPPGSVFKPFVALAGLRNGRLNPYSQLPCGPELIIDGRPFRNWTDKDVGYLDLNGALIRSCNTYFYQAAIGIGDLPILATARDFGFGMPTTLPISGIAMGDVPKRVPSAQGQANLAIGQSPLLASPLEVAMAMATLADGMRRPKARLVSQIQDQKGGVVSATLPAHHAAISYPTEALVAVHHAMYGVVNHRNGTATKARVPGLRVYGKTGTSQWARNGEMVNAVWFAGFVKDSDPPLAFAVALEGNKGERIFGGGVASPVAASVLNEIAASPAKFALRTRKVKAPVEDYPLIFNTGYALPEPILSLNEFGMPSVGMATPSVQVMATAAAAGYFDSYQEPRREIMMRYSSPTEVPRAVPVGRSAVPGAFLNQPPPAPNNYYERARWYPRERTNRFAFPSR